MVGQERKIEMREKLVKRVGCCRVPEKVPVTERALIQRINRAFKKENEFLCLKTTRGDRWRSDLGNYYLVDMNRNTIEAQHVDLEKLGRELNVLAPYETLWQERDLKCSTATT
jgi:ribose 5-phosphate isomerase